MFLYLLRNFGLNPDFIQSINDIYDVMSDIHDEITNHRFDEMEEF